MDRIDIRAIFNFADAVLMINVNDTQSPSPNDKNHRHNFHTTFTFLYHLHSTNFTVSEKKNYPPSSDLDLGVGT